MSQEKNKKISFALDLEQDYGRINEYSAFKNADELIALFKKYGLKLTIFVTGKIIEDKNEIIKKFKETIDCEFNLHSYSHEINKKITAEEKKRDFEKALEIYKKYFGKNPVGYRAPCGNITEEEIEWLKKENFLYSSSFIPTYRPGLFNNLKQKDEIFRYPNGLLEIPFSSLPLIKVPFSLSYFQLLGWHTVNFLLKRKKSPYIVFNFHLHNLSNLENMKQLKTGFRLGYIRNQDNGLAILENFIKTITAKGYQSVLMTEFAEQTIKK